MPNHWEKTLSFKESDRHREPAKAKMVQTGQLFMVSVSHPDLGPGTHFASERPGRNPREAALSYVQELDDNAGAQEVVRDPEMAIVCVIDPTLAASAKPWRVFMFQIMGRDFKNPKLIDFN